MAQKPNSFDRFWKELKRRKVFGVVTTYAATAYIIIEVTNNLAIPLHLPVWFASLEFIILLIGLPLVVILSWIFDFTPQGIKKTESFEESEKKEILVKPVRRKLRPSYILNAILIIAVIVLAYPKIFEPNTLERLRSTGERISVAIMPFQNMTNDTKWNIWQDGIQDELITSLTNSQDLQVRQNETTNSLIQAKGISNYALITPSVAGTISQKLDANVFIYGTIKQAGNSIRINAQLVDSNTGETFKSFQLDGLADNILHITDSLSKQIKNFFLISELEKELPTGYRYNKSTDSPEAFRYFIAGQNAFYKKDFSTASKLFSQALTIDTNFTSAALSLSMAYFNLSINEDLSVRDNYLLKEARKLCIKLYERREKALPEINLKINRLHAILFGTPSEEIQYLRQLLELDDQSPFTYYHLGFAYYKIQQYDKAIPELENALRIFKKWGSRPQWIYNYLLLGIAYHRTGQFKKEEILLKKAQRDFPDDLQLMGLQAILSYSQGDTIAANRYIKNMITYLKSTSLSEAEIATYLTFGSKESGLMNKTETYYRQALSLEPEKPERLNNLAYFLIDKDRNINEGLELINKALALQPDDYRNLHTKGWGLYKQGKYKQALEYLQKADSVKPIYSHELYLQLEAARKAVAEMKND